MKGKHFKIGYSDVGGIFIGRNIKSDFHKHYAITILISFGEPFKLTTTRNESDFYNVAIIQKNIAYSLESSKKDYTAFIHIVPFTEIGISLSDKNNPVRKPDINSFEEVLEEIKDWFGSSENNQQTTEQMLNKVSSMAIQNNERVIIDDRILKSLNLIMKSEVEKLPVKSIANKVNLSVSHFNRLFKKETGLTFRKFVLHSKLIRSIFAMYEKHNLTTASFIGGFSDQAHLSRTFRQNFGIMPSESLK